MDVESGVYKAARDGRLERLKMFLEYRDKDEIGFLVDAKTHGATPLVMACRNGHYDVAEYLIEKCDADIERPGTVVFDGEIIEGAPPLWCAAAAGHYSVVELLVRKGARVNSTTQTNSTPLRAACFDGHYDIVKFLVNHGADIESANRHGHTCLMIACFRGHVRITKYLLSLKADVNRKSIKGNTALHDSAESGSLDIVKLLIKYGARMESDVSGMTPLLTAAITGHTQIVEHLMRIPEFVSRKDKIDALELLGATYVDKKRDMVGALGCWKRAMEERYRQGEPAIPKPGPSPLVAAYDFAREISEPEALDNLCTDPDEMRMQALLVRERILGPAHPDTSYYIRYRGALYADGGKYLRCIELWNYALDIQQSMLEPLNPMTQSSFLSFTELFNFMIGIKASTSSRPSPLPLTDPNKILSNLADQIMRIFQKAILEVKLGKQMLEKVPIDKRDLTYLDRILEITLYFAYLLTREIPQPNTEEYVELHRALHKLVQINARGKQGRDVLHLIFKKDSIFMAKFPANEIPPSNLTKALLRAGADPMSTDDEGNTPLHLIGMSNPWRVDIAEALLNAGAHIDAVNVHNQSYETIVTKRFDRLNPIKWTTLSCLAARVVAKIHKIETVPKHLTDFVLMHWNH